MQIKVIFYTTAVIPNAHSHKTTPSYTKVRTFGATYTSAIPSITPSAMDVAEIQTEHDLEHSYFTVGDDEDHVLSESEKRTIRSSANKYAQDIIRDIFSGERLFGYIEDGQTTYLSPDCIKKIRYEIVEED